jgi:hypothetical protein
MQLDFETVTITVTRSELQDLYRSVKSALIVSIDQRWKKWPVDFFLANESQRLGILKTMAHFSYADYNTDLKELLDELEKAKTLGDKNEPND